jgi:serine/threonine protein kinase
LQLGRYQVLKHLASGGIADVLLARASGLEGFARHVVIKRMKPELAKEERFAKAFLDEARISASLNHQNIVQVHDIGEEGGSYFFAMEYVHGEDARTLLAKVRERNEHVPLEIAVAIIMSAAAGLHHAHEKTSSQGEKLGIVHRDVSPSNILVGYDGSVKLVDFGLAKAAQRSTTTAAGTLKGKASYMSPEQCKGEPVDRRTDTFCLGIVLYELVTAQRLFKGPTEYATMAAVVDGEIPPPSRLRADIPPALDAIILRALARKVTERYQTAEDFRAAVEAFAVEYELRTSNKALSDYLTRLFGQKPEPWQAGVEVRPIDDSTLAGERGAAVAPPILPPKKKAPEPEPEPEDDDDDSFTDDEVQTTLMPDTEAKAIEAEMIARQKERDKAKAAAAAGPAATAAPAAKRPDSDDDGDEHEEHSSTVVEPPAFESETDTDVEDAGATSRDIHAPIGKKKLNRPQADTVKSAARNPAAGSSPPGNTPARPAGGSSPPANTPAVGAGKSPPGAFPPGSPSVKSGKTPAGGIPASAVKSGKTPPGAFQPANVPAIKSGKTPPGAFPAQPMGQPFPPYPAASPYGASYPVMPGGLAAPGQPAPGTILGVGSAGPGSASVFSTYTPLPADVSLSKLAGLKKWLALYKRSIFLGGGLGVGVVIIMVIIMRACGDSPPPPARPDAMPPDAQEIKMAPPVDAAPVPDDAAKAHKRHGSGSAAR